jgi:multiple sugar transport system permease protein
MPGITAGSVTLGSTIIPANNTYRFGAQDSGGTTPYDADTLNVTSPLTDAPGGQPRSVNIGPLLNGLGGEQPFSFGSLDQLAQNWSALVGAQGGIIWAWLGNSVLYSGAALVITIIVSIPAGYTLAMHDFTGRRALLITTLMVMLIPNTALVLPVFLEINAVHLVGSPLAVILPFAFFPFGVYLAYIYFSTSVSRELLDAARIDGAGEFAVFRRIALPLAIPVVALVGFFNFITNWNNYFLPFVMLPGSKTQPIQVGLVELLANVREINPTTVASDSIPFPQLALATLISVAPVLIVFLFSQRFLVAGLTAGATKE